MRTALLKCENSRSVGVIGVNLSGAEAMALCGEVLSATVATFRTIMRPSLNRAQN